MGFVVDLFAALAAAPSHAALAEVHGKTLTPCDSRSLLGLVARARAGLRAAGVSRGDRVVLVAPNSTRWVAFDLAMLAEGLVVVPLYARQAPAELVEMAQDCGALLLVAASPELEDTLRAAWPDAPLTTFDELLVHPPVDEPPIEPGADELVTLIYTSGTSGSAKGVMWVRHNVDFMLPATVAAIDRMMGGRSREEVVFHYLPFCFAGSRIVLWTALVRGIQLRMSTDLDRLTEEIGTAKPNWFLNVPMLLERIRSGVEANLDKQVAPVRWLARAAIHAHLSRSARRRDRLVVAAARRFVFGAVRERLGVQLRCLICGSAPLNPDTQRWFELLDLPVYQVYGLTETTAILTMDRPPDVTPGRVGRLLDGLSAKISDEGELLVTGPNLFTGYWGRPEETATALTDGWFHTGDQCEADPSGNYQVIGRVKNIIVPTSGHNVAPEPIEQSIAAELPGLETVVVVGHGKPWLAALVYGAAPDEDVAAGLERVNADLPHYRRVRRFVRSPEALTPENGLLTANRKLKRAAIERRFRAEIDALYTTP